MSNDRIEFLVRQIQDLRREREQARLTIAQIDGAEKMAQYLLDRETEATRAAAHAPGCDVPDCGLCPKDADAGAGI